MAVNLQRWLEFAQDVQQCERALRAKGFDLIKTEEGHGGEKGYHLVTGWNGNDNEKRFCIRVKRPDNNSPSAPRSIFRCQKGYDIWQ